MTSRDDIRRWLDEAKREGATHLIVKWDDFEGPTADYPVLVMPGEDPHEVANRHSDPVVEVYAMHLPLEAQLAEYRAKHWEMPPAPVSANEPLPWKLNADEAEAARRYFAGDETAWPAVAESIERHVAAFAAALRTGTLSEAQDALVKMEMLFVRGPDTPCRTTWRDGVECFEIPVTVFQEAFQKIYTSLAPKTEPAS